MKALGAQTIGPMGYYKSEVPTAPSLSLIHLLGGLIRLRKPISSLAYNSGIARWKRYIEQSMGKGYGVSRPSQIRPLFLNLKFTNPETWYTWSFWIFMEEIITQWHLI